ncbi:uncharacterized protein LOC144012234 isoform X2 [Festucalex cinctus]
MSARTTPKDEEELFGVKEENEQHFQPLDDVCEQPRIVLHAADVGEKYLRPDQQDMKPPHVKEEEEHPYIEEEEKPVRVKEEAVEDDVTKLPPTFAPLKSEDEDKVFYIQITNRGGGGGGGEDPDLRIAVPNAKGDPTPHLTTVEIRHGGGGGEGGLDL